MDSPSIFSFEEQRLKIGFIKPLAKVSLVLGQKLCKHQLLIGDRELWLSELVNLIHEFRETLLNEFLRADRLAVRRLTNLNQFAGDLPFYATLCTLGERRTHKPSRLSPETSGEWAETSRQKPLSAFQLFQFRDSDSGSLKSWPSPGELELIGVAEEKEN